MKELGGRLTNFSGRDAAVIPSEGADIAHEVDFIVEGIMVRLLAERGVPLRDVVRLAKSIAAATYR